MKKYLFIFLCMSALLIFTACSDRESNESDLGTTDTHLDIFTGKVIEIKNDNTILIQITKERGGYKVDDKVYVQYEGTEVLNAYADSDKYENIEPNYKPVIGDEFTVQSFPDPTSKLNGYDYRESHGKITKFVYIDLSR